MSFRTRTAWRMKLANSQILSGVMLKCRSCLSCMFPLHVQNHAVHAVLVQAVLASSPGDMTRPGITNIDTCAGGFGKPVDLCRQYVAMLDTVMLKRFKTVCRSSKICYGITRSQFQESMFFLHLAATKMLRCCLIHLALRRNWSELWVSSEIGHTSKSTDLGESTRNSSTLASQRQDISLMDITWYNMS